MKSNNDKIKGIPQEIKQDLIDTVLKIKELLKDNIAFFPKLINKCLEVGKGKYVYSDDVKELLNSEYENLLDYEDGIKLFELSDKLLDFLCLNTPTLKNLIITTPYAYLDNYRNELEQIVHIAGDVTIDLEE